MQAKDAFAFLSFYFFFLDISFFHHYNSDKLVFPPAYRGSAEQQRSLK